MGKGSEMKRDWMARELTLEILVGVFMVDFRTFVDGRSAPFCPVSGLVEGAGFWAAGIARAG